MDQPLQSFKLPRFKSGEPLLSQLSASRLNAMLEAIEANRVLFGVNTTGQRTPAGTIIRANPPAGSGGAQPFPFKVFPSQDRDGNFQVTVFRGLVGTVVPQMSGIDLDNDPPPILYVGTNPLWLQVFVKLSTNPADYRAVIDPEHPPQIFQDSHPHVDLQMNWTGSPADYSSGVGYFYLKIAEITIADPVPPSTTRTISVAQYLYTNLSTFLLTVDQALIFA
jgi:hypothetical protein